MKGAMAAGAEFFCAVEQWIPLPPRIMNLLFYMLFLPSIYDVNLVLYGLYLFKAFFLYFFLEESAKLIFAQSMQ